MKSDHSREDRVMEVARRIMQEDRAFLEDIGRLGLSKHDKKD